MLLRKLNKVLVLLVASVLLLSVSPLLSYGFEGLGLDPNLVEKVSDSAMDDMRGRYYGFYFSINFSGYWDTLGSIPMAKLTYDAGLGTSTASGSITMAGVHDNTNGTASDDASTSNSSDTNTPVVKTSAVVGGSGLNGTNGVLQLTQVPGSQNFVYSGIAINLTIFNIQDTTGTNLRDVLSSMVGGTF